MVLFSHLRWCFVAHICVILDSSNKGRIANTRPVATIEKWATGRVMQRLVLARSVGHGGTGFRLRFSQLPCSLKGGVSSQWCR